MFNIPDKYITCQLSPESISRTLRLLVKQEASDWSVCLDLDSQSELLSLA